jgi:hypothetical protein
MSLRSHILLFGTMVILVYAASLMWVFPGEFHPLTPHHPDGYVPVGLLSRPALEIASWPRPVMVLFLRTAGYLGVEHALAMPIAAVLGAALLALFAISRFTGEWPSPIAVLAYLVLLFTHPQFYFHHRHDATAGLATLFLFLTFMAALSWLRAPRWSSYAWTLVLTALMALSKETYALSLPFLVGALCLLDWRNSRWKRALALAGGVCAVEAIALGYDILRFLHFTGPLEPNSTYTPDLHPASILAVFWRYCADAFSPFSAACCGVALLAVGGLAYRKRTAVVVPLAFVVAGLLALIPNATIPRHYDAQYAWNAAPLVFAVVLFVPVGNKLSALANTAVLVLALVSIRANAPVYASTGLQWLLGQERVNGQIVRALPEIRARTAGAHRIIVSGLGASYHPWEMSDFLRQYFGRDVEWTFVIQRTWNESLKPNVAMLKSSSVRLDEYECAVRFHENGQLRDVLVGSAFRAAARETPQAILIPSLPMKLAALHAQPEDSTLLLQVGAEAVAWGEPAWALPYLQRASQGDPLNPYSWFFMGQAESDLKDYDSARADYQKAIATAGRDQNPAFAEALSTLPAR